MDRVKINVGDWIPLLITLNVGLLAAYLTRDPNMHGLTSTDLMYILPWTLIAALAAIVIITIKNHRKITEIYSKVGANTWILVLVILLGGAYLRTFVVPQTHRIFFDEQLYMGIANSIATEGKAIMCNRGRPNKCIEGVLNKDPNGYPVLAAISYFLFGTGEQTVYMMEALVGVLSILLVFLIAYLLFNSEKTALYCAFVFALIPSHIVWSGSAAAEIIALFFTLASVLYALFYIKTGDNQLLLATALLLAYAAQVRPENGLSIILVGVLIVIKDRELPVKIKTYGFCTPLIVLIILLTPHMIHLSHANRTDNWGAEHGKIGARYLKYNVTYNAGFLMDGKFHPIAFTLFALVGLAYLIAYRSGNLVLLTTWFLLFFGLYGVFYSGNFDSGGIGHRFALIVSAPLVFFAGYGMNALSKIAGRADGNRTELIATAAIIIVSLYSFSTTLDFITTPDKQAQYAREMHDFAVAHASELADNCHILNHNPGIFLVQGKPSLQTWFGGNQQVMNEVFAETDCVYFLEGAWCLFEPHKSGVCQNMHTRYNLTTEWSMTRKENPKQVFTFYRVRRK